MSSFSSQNLDPAKSAIEGLLQDNNINNLIKEHFLKNSASKLKQQLTSLSDFFGYNNITNLLFLYAKNAPKDDQMSESVEKGHEELDIRTPEIKKQKITFSQKEFQKAMNIANEYLNKKREREMEVETEGREWGKEGMKEGGKESTCEKRGGSRCSEFCGSSEKSGYSGNSGNIWNTEGKHKKKKRGKKEKKEECSTKKQGNKTELKAAKSKLKYSKIPVIKDKKENFVLENKAALMEISDLEESFQEYFSSSEKYSTNSYDFSNYNHNDEYDARHFYFNGDRVNGKKSGFGVYINRKTLAYYKGNWLDNKLQGYGCYNDRQNNIIYEGNFKDTLYDGIGNLRINDKKYEEYEGEFSKDKKHGFGINYFNRAKTKYYKGEFKNGVKCGIGISYTQGRFTYECEYKNDTEDGIGVLKYDDGDLYKGEIHNAYLDGYGTHHHGKKGPHFGCKYYGKFIKGKPKYGIYVDEKGNCCDAIFTGLNVKQVVKLGKQK